MHTLECVIIGLPHSFLWWVFPTNASCVLACCLCLFLFLSANILEDGHVQESDRSEEVLQVDGFWKSKGRIKPQPTRMARLALPSLHFLVNDFWCCNWK